MAAVSLSISTVKPLGNVYDGLRLRIFIKVAPDSRGVSSFQKD